MKNIPLSQIGFKTLLLLLVIFVSSCQVNSGGMTRSDYLQVKSVVDGDTFWVYDGSEKGLKVRLIGVDTPETVHPRKPVEHYGMEASEYVKSLLEGSRVRLEYDVGPIDRYGRALAYVYLENGTFLNVELLKRGYARIMTIPPNVKHANYFLKVERKARNKKRGLWKREITGKTNLKL